jgi:two-component system heavy metal sensor histidine kinase CusS
MRRPLSLAARLTVLFGVAAAVVFPLFGWIISRSIERHFAEGDTNELRTISVAVERALAMPSNGTGAGRAEQRFDDILVGHHSAALSIVSPERGIVYARGAQPDSASLLEMASDRGANDTVYRWDDGGHSYRVLQHSLTPAIAAAVGGETLMISVPLDYHLGFLANFHRTLWLMIAASIAGMSVIGWVAVRWGHAPLRSIASRMQRITASDLHARVPPASVPRELANLAESFNGVLERLDESFQRLSNFNADIAHELRTPITNLMMQTQVALSRARTVEAYREVLYSNMEEYERMAQMIGDMLFLAQADKTTYPIASEDIGIGEAMRALVDYYEGWAEEAGVALLLDGDARIRGDRRMLQRAFANLISNAIRHTPSGGAVQIAVSAEASGATRIVVRNPGAKIEPEHLPRLFDRFYRVDQSRQRSAEGAGLGLAIVKSIVDAHGGTIRVRSTDDSTSFEIVLPAR